MRKKMYPTEEIGGWKDRFMEKNRRLKKFLSYYGIYWKEFTFVMTCAFLGSIAALFVPLCISKVTSLALEGKEAVGTIISSGLLLLGLVLVRLVFEYLFDVRGHVLGARMENDLRMELFAHLEKLSFSFYDHHKTGTLMSSLTNDLLDLTELFHHGPEDYIMSAVRLIGASIILFSMEWRLTLIMLVIMAALVWFTLFWAKRLRKVHGVNQERIAGINDQASDVLGGIRTVQSFNAEESQYQRFFKAGKAFFQSRRDVYYNESYADKTTFILTQLCFVAVILMGGFMVYKGSLNVAELIAFILYIQYLTDPITHLAWMVEQFQTGMAGFDRVMTLLETEPEIKEDPKAKDISVNKGEISFEHVNFSYIEQMPVLKDLSLKLKAGEFTALVGVSGSGKSTLGMLLPRFYEPQQGEITIDGAPISEFSIKSLRSQIAWVQQDVYLLDASVAENIALGDPKATREEIQRAAELADADGFIRQLPEGYDSLVGERGVRLSGGQRQRIGIARAILKNAPILILDEATSALDNAAEARVYAALRKEREGKTTLVIAHRLSTIKDADRIFVLEDGCAVENGRHEELLSQQGTYAKLYQKEIG